MAMATTTYEMEAMIRGYHVCMLNCVGCPDWREAAPQYILFSTSSPVHTLDIRMYMYVATLSCDNLTWRSR